MITTNWTIPNTSLCTGDDYITNVHWSATSTSGDYPATCGIQWRYPSSTRTISRAEAEALV